MTFAILSGHGENVATLKRQWHTQFRCDLMQLGVAEQCLKIGKIESRSSFIVIVCCRIYILLEYMNVYVLPAVKSHLFSQLLVVWAMIYTVNGGSHDCKPTPKN